ncbi:MAG TPA: hypothetical protein VF516_14710 [Kofleriaceae bacterium]
MARKLLALMVSVAPACLVRELPVDPGNASVTLSGPWIQGQPGSAALEWPNKELCDEEDWSCTGGSRLTMTVMSVQCSGCDVLDDPTGRTALNGTSFVAMATTDGPILVTADLRFDATGEIRRVVASATGDHEVMLEAPCRLLDPAVPINFDVPDSQLRDCTTTRRPDDRVVVFPLVRTYHGALRLPFGCYDLCSTTWFHKFRSQSSIAITPPPVDWGHSSAVHADGYSDGSFAILPPLGSTSTVSLSAPLASGEISTVSVAIPPVQ